MLWYRADGTPVSDQGPGHVLRITQGVPEQVTVWTLPRDGLVGVDMIARTPFGAGDDRFSILNAYLAQTMDDTSPYTGRLNTVVLFERTVTDVVPRYSTGGLANESVHVQAWPEEGKTVLVATHDMNLIRQAKSQLAARVLTQEHRIYSRAIADLLRR